MWSTECFIRAPVLGEMITTVCGSCSPGLARLGLTAARGRQPQAAIHFGGSSRGRSFLGALPTLQRVRSSHGRSFPTREIPVARHADGLTLNNKARSLGNGADGGSVRCRLPSTSNVPMTML
jgi:hypothetical protein